MKKYFSFLLLLSFFLFLTGCSKGNMEPEAAISYQKIGEGYAAGAATKVTLYAKQGLATGYNTLYLSLTDSLSGQPLENAQITLLPIMDMGTMKHAAPVENPTASAKDKLFASAVVFTMPSGSMGSWTLEVNISAGNKQGRLVLPVTVTEPPTSRLKSFVSKADSSKFFVALLQPEAPKVGVNDLEIAIYKVNDRMGFPADSSLSVTLTPEMPTMGHGSPNNVDPVHTQNGHYKGKVNFTMTGLWQVNLGFNAGTAIADTATSFEINF